MTYKDDRYILMDDMLQISVLKRWRPNQTDFKDLIMTIVLDV